MANRLEASSRVSPVSQHYICPQTSLSHGQPVQRRAQPSSAYPSPSCSTAAQHPWRVMHHIIEGAGSHMDHIQGDPIHHMILPEQDSLEDHRTKKGRRFPLAAIIAFSLCGMLAVANYLWRSFASADGSSR